MTNAELGLPEYTVRKLKKPKPRYIKPQSIIQLQEDYTRWYYANRSIDKSMQIVNKFYDNSANELTKAIMIWFKINGHFAARINSGATYDPRLGIYRKGSGATAGMADINAVVKGKSISVEVKYGKDRIRESQIKVKSEIELAGGIYFIARTFDGFLEQIKLYI